METVDETTEYVFYETSGPVVLHSISHNNGVSGTDLYDKLYEITKRFELIEAELSEAKKRISELENSPVFRGKNLAKKISI